MPVDTDEFDPTSPFVDRLGPTEATIDADLDGNPLQTGEPSTNLFLPDGTPDWERGFGEGSGTVRVWCTPEGEIRKVRVSTTWREKLGVRGKAAEAQAAALSSSFVTTFGVINIVTNEQTPDVPRVTAEGPGPVPITWERLNRINVALDETHEKLRAIPPGEGDGTWRGSIALGHGAGGRVRVRLNTRGGYSGIEFNPQWLADSNVGMICNAVPEAARDAKRRFVPPEYVPGERDELNNRVTALRQELSAMMQRGFE